jgi:hypothetical protein
VEVDARSEILNNAVQQVVFKTASKRAVGYTALDIAMLPAVPPFIEPKYRVILLGRTFGQVMFPPAKICAGPDQRIDVRMFVPVPEFIERQIGAEILVGGVLQVVSNTIRGCERFRA